MNEGIKHEGTGLSKIEAIRINETLTDLEATGPSAFVWAWEQIGNVLIKEIELKEKLTPEVKAVYEKHSMVMNLWDNLNARIFDSGMDYSVISDGEFHAAIDEYHKFVKDLDAALI